LLNVIAGLLPVQSGRVELFGAPIRGVHPAIGYMFQQHALLPWRTVLANVELGLELSGVPRHERQRRAAPCLAALGLQGFERHFPSELSGGMRQRVSLARLLVDAPQLILMDEPFGALDAQTRLLVQEMFLRIWEADRPTVMFVTHDLAEAIALADRVVVMSARPARIKQQYVVDIPRPRKLDHLSKVPRFADLLESLWGDLRAEALVAMQGA
jgi:NitT/TauT family transport system ATP-binding protein